MRFLEKRDGHFDLCRSFLVVAMIVSHTYQSFYFFRYNVHLTYFILIAFVWLSGITVGIVSIGRVKRDPKSAISNLIFRGIKLLGLFLAANAVTLAMMPDRLDVLNTLHLSEIASSILLLTRQGLFAFDVLVPIALTIAFSGFIIFFAKEKWNRGFFLLILFSATILVIEANPHTNYYGPKLVLVGLMGCAAGQVVSLLDWDRIILLLKNCAAPARFLSVAVAAYFGWIFFFSKNQPVLIAFHLIPTILLLLWIYGISMRFRLERIRWTQAINQTLAGNMLFAYLFHILVLRFLVALGNSHSLSFAETMFLSVAILALTAAACRATARVNSASPSFRMVYNAILR